MPYALKDRQEFIERLCLKSDAQVLDLGGSLSGELQSSVSGITSQKHKRSAILLNPSQLPFKNCVFDAVVSYHYFDTISSYLFGSVLKEILRVMKEEAILSFMITFWGPQNESQRSNLFFHELMKTAHILFHHELEDISVKLTESGFRDITAEGITREINIPNEFMKSHLMLITKILKMEKEKNTDIKTLTKQYVAHVKMHGESLLPAIHFTAKKI